MPNPQPSRPVRHQHLPLAYGFPNTHEELELHHNRMEHQRNPHGDAAQPGHDSYEPVDDYDLDMMPRGV